ncbi:SGNH/GDSL hydrolase family protein [Nocardioides panacisoli]|uniref:SGNH/GDSL hydrolase family protein n=1 Tax=Nocardioides panacisoli TaxID=627624 RepID=A0ABP7IQC2_9ACTN
MRFHRYVALGDSQTEGLNDLDGHGGIRGWADRFAAYLAETNPDLLYANLAIRGRRTVRIRADQLEPALALQPDLASVMAGANDVLGRFVLEETMTDLEAMYAELRAAGATVLGCTFPDPGATFSIARHLTPRVRALNEAIRDAARRHGVILVDFEAYPAVADPRWWSRDRLHLTTAGHTRMATAFADVLGVRPDPSWQDPLPPLSPRAWWRSRVEDADWLARYWLPWLYRHLRGLSTGDNRLAKRPELGPVFVPAAAIDKGLPEPGDRA